MNTKYAKSESRYPVAALGAALLFLSLTAGTALAGSSARVTKQADPFAKGATRQIEIKWVAPGQLPSELKCLELAERHTNWHRLHPELFRCLTERSNYKFNIAIHQLNQNPGRPVLVMINGVLSDYSTWEYIAPELTLDHEVWLVDLPGCGESDAPDPTSIEADGYSPTGMAERILQALEQRLNAGPGGSTRFLVLVGHSLGGTVCIRLLSAPEFRISHKPVLDRISHMVVLAPSDLAIHAVPPKFLPLLELTKLKVTLGRLLGVLDPKIRDLTKANYFREGFATVERQELMTHMLQDAAHRKAAQAMLLQFVSFNPKTRRPDWRVINALVADYKNISVPVLIVHGTWDETLSSAMGHKLKDEIRGASLVEMPRSGHCLPTEQPAICTDLIRQFAATSRVHLPPGSELTVYPGYVPATDILARIFPVGIPAE